MSATATAPTPEVEEVPQTENSDAPPAGYGLEDLIFEIADITKDVQKRINSSAGHALAITKTALDYHLANRSLNIQQMAQQPPFPFPMPHGGGEEDEVVED